MEVYAPPGVTQPAAVLDTYDVHGCPEGGTICCGDSGASHRVGPRAELLVSPSVSMFCSAWTFAHKTLVHVFSPRPVEGRVFLHKCMEAGGGFRLLVVADVRCCIFLLKLVDLPAPPLFDV